MTKTDNGCNNQIFFLKETFLSFLQDILHYNILMLSPLLFFFFFFLFSVLKAAHYFGVKIVHVDVDPKTLKPDMEKYARAVGPNTILLVVSAPQYPHGVVDPVEEAARLALERGLPLHVDGCIGGFALPWVEKLGRPVPLWDFRVKGKTLI